MTLSLILVATLIAFTTAQTHTVPQIVNDGYWSNVGSMALNRSDLGVSSVNNAIIITGGCLGPQIPFAPCSYGCPTITEFVEGFYPANNSFVRLADMPRKRYRHSTEVVDGLLYAIGGRDLNDTIITAVDVYDFSTNTWSTSKYSLSAQWYSDFSTFVYNGTIWMIGGYSADYQIISPAIATFTPFQGFVYNAIAPMTDPRGDTCATTDGSTIYVVGGFDPASGANYSTPVSTLEVFDFNTKTWSYGPATPTPGGDKACGIMNGRLHVFGGEGKDITDACVYSDPESNTEEFNLVTKTWSEEPPMSTYRFRFAAEYFNNNGRQTLYVFGGQGRRNTTGDFYPTLASVEMYTDTYYTISATRAVSSVTKAANDAGRAVFAFGLIVMSIMMSL